MTTMREYSYLDSGAPVIATDSTSRVDLALHAILVTGYGSKAAAGWTREYTGTSKAVFRNSVAAGGTGHRFRIVDNGSETAGYRVATIQGYVDMTDVDTGVGSDIMPNATDYPTGGQILRGNALAATARPWYAWADELTCYLWIDGNGTFQTGLHGFGDFASEVPSDAYRSFVLHQQSAWTNGGSNSRIHGNHAAGFATPSSGAQSRGLSVMRGYSGTSAGAVLAAPIAIGGSPGNFAAGGSGGANAPIAAALSPGSSQRYFAPMMIAAEGMIRGRLRGLYSCLNDLRSLTNAATESGSVGLPVGSVLRMMRCSSGVNTGSEGVIGVETGVSW